MVQRAMSRGDSRGRSIVALALVISFGGVSVAAAQDGGGAPPVDAAADPSPAVDLSPAADPLPAPALDEAATEEAAPPEEVEERTRRFYVEVSGGYTWINLAQIRENNLIPEPELMKTQGPAVGGGAGLFWHALTLGAQAELSFHDFFNLGTLAFDIGFRIPTPHVEPYFRAGFGYAWMWNIDPQGLGFEMGTGDIPTIHGIVFDLGFGLDVMITDLIAIGVGVDAAGFSLRRKADSLASAIPDPSFDELEPGDALGVQISALAQLSLHF